jgi:hypothetical protein
MPAEAEPIGSCGGAPGNEPAYPRPGAPAHETGPTGVLPEKLMACPEFRRKDDINLNIYNVIAQGHFVSPRSGHGSL